MSAGAYGSSVAVKDLLGGLWSSVAIEPPSETEQRRILAELFPGLAPLVGVAMATLQLGRRAAGQRGGLPEEWTEGGWTEGVTAALAANGFRGTDAALHVGRHFSMRDLIKWCRRMQV